jgi:23S rRNA (guanosine2251-2'-O)-methyltransferase
MKDVLWGFHPVEEALLTGNRRLGILYLARKRDSARSRHLTQLARQRGARVKEVDVRTLDRLASGQAHQGVVATVEARPARGLDDLLAELAGRGSVILVVLDGVQDPHNLGAVVRNACLNGAAAVLLPRDRTAGVTPVVEKVAAGGLEHVDIVRVVNIAAALRALKKEDFWIVGADPGGEEELPGADLTGRVALVIGGEHQGLRRLTKEHCDRLVRIPSTGRIESYNMGTASALFLFSAFLQHRGGEP